MKRLFFLEAIKITLFCLVIAGVYWLLGVSQPTLLIMFNVAVMACASTFSLEKKSLRLVAEGTMVILFSILFGAVIGFYLPILSKFFCVVYAVLAFLLPRTKAQRTLFVTGAVMFLIFSSLPFNFHQGLTSAIYGLLIVPLILLFYGLFDFHIYSETIVANKSKVESQIIPAYIAGVALSGAWGVGVLLNHYTNLTHLYWIGLTALVVIQGSQGKTIRTSLLRIGVNTCGALIVVVLMTYIVPNDFWVNFSLLVVFLFGIFALGFSYVWRSLFIELFVLSFTHLLGKYQNIIAYDRILLTLIGGLLVIISTLLIYQFSPSKP